MREIESYVAGLPKAELHVHIEGTLEPELAFRLAQRNKVTMQYESVDALKAAYSFGNLQEFLDLYYAGLAVLLTEQDFEQLAREYFEHAAQQNIRHVEFFFDPQAHIDRGISINVAFNGLLAASRAARANGMSVSIIASFLRHLSEASAFETLEALEPYRHEIVAVGLDSSELGHPPSKFARVFAQARGLGYKLVAHAGEEGPPEYVWEAIDLLGVDRIDHGNRAMEDSALVYRLRQDRMPLTVCPLSNLSLGVVDTLQNHPLKKMLDAGLMVTINSDDPAYFGGYLNTNYVQIAEALNLGEDELAVLAANSLAASFG